MTSKSGPTPPNELRSALAVLEVFAHSAGVSFDRLLASRLLDEARRSVPGDDVSTWAQRLIEVGESLDLRVRRVECVLNDVLVFPRQGIPVAMCRDDAERHDDWILISESDGNRVKLVDTNDLTHHEWVSVRQLLKMLGESSDRASVRWIVGQAAMECESLSNRSIGDGGQPPSPVARLLRVMQPEKSDLWAVVIFSIVVGVLALASPIAVEALVNTVAFGQYLQPVVVLAFILLIFLGFAAGIRGLIAYIVEIIQRRLFVRVIEDLAYRLPRVTGTAWDGNYGPELVNRFFDVVTLQKVAASLLLDGTSIVLQTVIGMAVLAFYHPFLLGFDIVLLASIAFIIFVLGRGAVKTSIKESKQKYKIGAWLEELARNTTAFRLHGGAQFAMDRADMLAVEYLDARKQHFRVVLRQLLFALGLQAVAATALLGLGGWLVILGELTLGQLVAAELIVMIIVGSFAKLGKHVESFYDILAGVDKLGVLFDLPTEARDRLFHLSDERPARIRLSGVAYKYGSQAGLSAVSCEIRPGEHVAVTGPPASGKSTMVDLLSGLRQPTEGHVEIDGMDLRELRPDSLRQHLAVAKGVEVFHGTIAENVHLYRPHINARDLRDALNAVGLLETFLQLPDGLETELQSDGKPLSESQAQRLMLARAIAGRPRLLVIDGTLDALPAEMARKVIAELTSSDRCWTLVVATNRQEVMDKCDRVITLDLASSDKSVDGVQYTDTH